MGHYSDEIINATLRENYFSQAAADETARQAAEKAYKTELTNGPKKIVTPTNGKPFTIGVGSFDLENMHKAYDSYYVQNGLLDIFADDGKLKDKATYGKIKTLDKNESAVKALYKLWSVQFGKEGMQFTSAKDAGVKEKQAKQDRQAQRYANIDRFKAEIQPKLGAALIELAKGSDAWKDFINAYPESERKTLDLACTNATYWFEDEIDLTSVLVDLTGDFVREKVRDSQAFSFEMKEKYQNLDDLDADLPSLVEKTFKANEPDFEAWLGKLRDTARAYYYLKANLDAFMKRPEAEILKDGDFAYIGYYDPIKKAAYKATKKEFNDGKDILLLTDMANAKNKVTLLKPDFELVMVRTAAGHDETERQGMYATTSSDRHLDYYDSKYPDWVLTSFGITFKSESRWDSEVKVEVRDVEPSDKLSKFFDKVVDYRYSWEDRSV